jgi:G6PDH family F420-dependent oxidoreductase
VAVSGPESGARAGAKADVMIAVEPDAALVERFTATGGAGKKRVGQVPVSFDHDRDAAVGRARELFGWFGGGWKVNSELPGPAAFEAASQFVRPEDVAEAIPCGDRVEDFVKAVDGFAAAGFTHVALCQVGGDTQADFIAWADKDLLPALRAERSA